MNIIVKTSKGHYIVRPDTTWERDNEDFFPPEFVDSLSFTPVLFARISKPGRSIGLSFTSRYYDGVNYGVLLYPDNLLGDAQTGFAEASCIDHTSFLPFPVYKPVTMGQKDNFFILKKNGEEIFSYNAGTLEMIESAISEASKRVYMRSGDIVAIELTGMSPLAKRSEGTVEMEASFCNNHLMDFKIIY